MTPPYKDRGVTPWPTSEMLRAMPEFVPLEPSPADYTPPAPVGV